ncbi:MAG: hypothetical protein QOF21_1154, partial [Actinomycetota bacterium]
YSGREPIYVIGYEEEQFLRIDRRGVFENLRSPATYINKTRTGTNPPGSADPRATPQWHKISSGHVARWHDHRIHWMGGVNPPAVRAAPGKRHVVVPDWKVEFTQGTLRTAAGGNLLWVPGPSPAPMLLLAVALGALIVLASKRMRQPFLAVAVATGVLVVIDIVHSVAIGFANAGTFGQQLGRTLASSTVSIPAWVVGIGAVWILARKRVDGFFAAVFAGLIVAVVGGVADSTVLSRSQVPFALSTGLARLIVAASLGMGVGVAVASALAIKKLEPRVVDADDD